MATTHTADAILPPTLPTPLPRPSPRTTPLSPLPTSLPTTTVPPPSLQTTTVVVHGPPVPSGQFYYPLPPPITLNSPAQMKDYLRNHSKPHGYTIVTLRSGAARSSCNYICHKSGTGEPRTKKLADGTADPVPKAPNNPETPKTNCPFRIDAPKILAGTGPDGEPVFAWKISYDRPKDHVGHNHPPDPVPTLTTSRTITIPVGTLPPALCPPANPASAANQASLIVPSSSLSIPGPDLPAIESSLSIPGPNLPAIESTSPTRKITSSQLDNDHAGVRSIEFNGALDSISSPVRARAVTINALTPLSQQRILRQIDTLLAQASKQTSTSESEVTITAVPGDDEFGLARKSLPTSPELAMTCSEVRGSPDAQINQRTDNDESDARSPSIYVEASRSSVNTGTNPATTPMPTNTRAEAQTQIADRLKPEIPIEHGLKNLARPSKKKKVAHQVLEPATSSSTAHEPRCQTRAQKAAAQLTALKGKSRAKTRQSSR